MRVLHLPTAIGANPQGISKHLKILGEDSKTMVWKGDYRSVPADIQICHPGLNPLFCELKRWTALRYIFGNWDVVHFNYGSSLMDPHYPWHPTWPLWKNLIRAFYSKVLDIAQLFELSVLKWRGIKTFVHYQGDDARQGEFCQKNFRVHFADKVDSNYYNPVRDAHKRKLISRMNHFCNGMYAVNPDLMHVLPSRTRFVPYSHLSLEHYLPVYNQQEDGPLRIGHAPTHRKVKGTDEILTALKELKEEGYEFELDLVEGLTHDEALNRYKKVHVLIDQIYAGWYGGLALEAIALGKPVLVYIRKEDLVFIPEEMKKALPFIQIEPDSLKKDLRKLLETPRNELFERAILSRKFAEKWHDPLKIAKVIYTDYKAS